MKSPFGGIAAALLLAGAGGGEAVEGYRSRTYVGSHNELVRMLRDRCAAAGLAARTYGNLVEKNPASTDPAANSVSQDDLELLRFRTVSLLKGWYLVPPEEFVPDAADPYTAFPWAYPALMRNVGDHAGQFTKVPGEHCASGHTIYTNSFTDAPVLPVHLWELYDVIRRMRYTRPLGYSGWTANGELNENSGGTGGNVTSWPEAQLFSLAFLSAKSRNNAPSCGSWGKNTGYLYQASIWRRYSYLTLDTVPAVSHVVRFFYFADTTGYGTSAWDDCGDGLLCRRWAVWDTQGPSLAKTHMSAALGGPPSSLPQWCDEPFQNTTSRGYTVAGVAAVLDFDGLYDSPPELFFEAPEWECDGLDFKCRECAPGPTVKWGGSASRPVVSMPAGIPNGTQTAGERLPAFFTESFVDGAPRLNYSPDTKLLGHCQNAAEGWEYAIVARPSGAEVPFALEGSLAGGPVEPFEQQAYRMEKEGTGYVLDLNDGRDSAYRFDSTGQAQEIRVAPSHQQVSAAVTPDNWLGVTAERSQTRVTSVSSPAMLSQVTYAGDGTTTGIKYYSPSGTLLSSVAMSTEGSTRFYREKDASGALVRETRVVQEKGRAEVWRGREETGGFTGSREIRSGVYVLNTGRLVQTVTNMLLQAGAEPKVAVRKRVFEWNGRGFQLIAETNGVPGSGATWTAHDYYDAPGPSGRMAMLKETRDSDGSWARYLYDRYDRVATERRPFSSCGPDSPDSEKRITRNYYAGDTNLAGLRLPADDVASRHDGRPRLVVEEALGREVSRSYAVYLPDRTVAKQCAVPGACFDAASSLTTTTYCHTNGQFNGRIRLVEHSDGTRTAFQYAFDAGSGRTTATIMRGAGEGDSVTNGTKTVSVEDAAGRTIEERTEDIASGLVLSRAVHYRDAAGREICASNALNGTFSTKIYGCCGPERVVDEAGIETVSDYDPLGRVMARHRLGVSTYYEYDAFGNSVRETIVAGTEPAIVTGAAFDAAGRRVSETDAMGNVTAIAYATNTLGGKTVVVTHADGSTSVSAFHRDGRQASVAGSAEYPACYEYGVTTQGEYSVEYRGSGTFASEWVRTESDMLGRAFRTVRPNGHAVRRAYDGHGREVEESDGTTRTISEYNSLGERFRTVADMNGNGTIDLAGPDRVSETESSVESNEGKVCRVARQYLYPDDGSAARLLASESFTAVDGSGAWQISFGRTNRSTVAWNRSAASRIETSVGPEGVGDIAVYTNGLMFRRARLTPAGAEFDAVTFAWDAFGRQSAVFSTAANGDQVVTRFEYDRLGRVTNTTVSAGGGTRSTLSQFDSMGRRIRAVLPDGAVQEFAYDTRGNLIGRSGARQYPVTFTYTDQGRIATMSTYRNGLSGAADTTTWQYDPGTGLLIGKRYPSDPSHLSYSYLPDGRLASRTWARGDETRYSYNEAGEVCAIDYSDATPDVSFAYDRLGRQIAVTDARGASTFAYDNRLQLVSETQVSGFSPHSFTNTLTRSYDSLGRASGYVLSSLISNLESRISYRYDSTGRLSSILSSNSVESALRADYLYSPSDFLAITGRVVTAGGNPVLQCAAARDAFGRVLSMRNACASGEVLGNSYQYNDADQRTANVLADGSAWAYRYDDLGQVVSGKKRFADGMIAGGAQFEYSFDTIGNRVSARNFIGQRTKSEDYTANALNQYEQRSVPGQVWVAGEAAAEARVTARIDQERPVLASRHGRYFWAVVPVSNELGTVASTNLTITASLPVPAGAPTCMVVRTESREVIVPGTPQRFTYDADGNLLGDGVWSYAWDAENRLTRMTPILPNSETPTLSFSYDYLGRRIRKTVSQWNTDHWSLVTDHSFLYDGWNLVSEVRSQGSEVSTNTYVWGPDLSGSLQGAGGIGGLIAASFGGAAYRQPVFPFFDASGNVVALASTSGVIVASYEYGPFGEPLRSSGPASSWNPFRFSTKYTDPETGLLYYGYRYYSPSLGRWLNRDPIGERGGANGLVFVGNYPIDVVDPIGLAGYFFDGTGNHPYTRSLDGSINHLTNVRIMYNAYSPDNGRKFYAFGIGSGYSAGGQAYSKQNRDSRIRNEAITGDTMVGRAKWMLASLESELKAGDKVLDVVGFSRGAATALQFLSEVERRSASGNPLYCGIVVRFVGLFDAVSSLRSNALLWPSSEHSSGELAEFSLSIPNGLRYGSRPVHFVALDEQRAQFQQIDIRGAKQIGFRGVHSDVGGGYGRDNSFSWLTLRDMVVRARNAGVEFDDDVLRSLTDTAAGDLFTRAFDPKSVPSENSEIYYNDNEQRQFPAGMKLHYSVFMYETKPKNTIRGL